MSSTSKNVPATAPKSGQLAAYDYGDASNIGFEGTSQDDFSIPFLGVLQSNSPLVSDNEDARPGMIVNTVTGELIKGSDGIVFIPSATQHNYIEWRKRDAGGGFVSARDLADPQVVAGRQSTKFGKIPASADTELVETFTVFGIAVAEDGTTQPVAVSFSSTKIKKYKGWMTKANMIQLPADASGLRRKAPLPAHRYRLKTIKEKNNKGEFFNWDIVFDGANATECRLAGDDPLFLEAVSLNKMVLSGAAKANHASVGGTEGGSGGDQVDDEIPF